MDLNSFKNAKMLSERMTALKNRVLIANLELVEYGLVCLTWGNASEIDRELGIIAIKPSGVPYDKMTADNIVFVDTDGRQVEDGMKPSSDLATHIELYRSFPDIGGVVHTHSTYATAFAQARRDIPTLGTTHADTFLCNIPCTRDMKSDEIASEYEKNTGKVIAECFATNNIDPNTTPAVLVASHGVFSWGKNSCGAVQNALIAERVAELAYFSLSLPQGNTANISDSLLERHFFRKHGKNATYGQV